MNGILRRNRFAGAGLAIALSLGAAWAANPDVAQTQLGLPLVFHEEFESGHTDHWEPTDARAWKLAFQGDNHVYHQFQQSQYEPKVRSPFNRNLVKDVVVGDFVFDVNVRSTGADNAHRDLCLFFGYQDPSHLYYVHLGKQADAHANSIFLVNDAPRVSIAKERTTGTPWDDEWHHVRIVRRVESGEIKIYFDDMEKPAMTAIDQHFTWGRVGIGSFDDTGFFDNVRVWGTKVEGK